MSRKTKHKADASKVVMTAEDSVQNRRAQELGLCEISSRFLYSTFLDIVESPEPNESWEEDTLRVALPAWRENVRTAWQAVDVLAKQMDAGDTGANKWSLKTKVALRGLYNSIHLKSEVTVEGESKHTGDFADFIRRLRRHPELLLPGFARHIAEVDALVTMMEIMRSLGPAENLLNQREIEMSATVFADAARVSNKYVSENKDKIGALTFAKAMEIRASKDGRRRRRKPKENAEKIAKQLDKNEHRPRP